VSDALKGYFRRPRPAWWYRDLETSYAYASGHAALSLTFYGFAAYVIAGSALPLIVKRLAIAVCGVMVIGIGWSRLALGAHYPTDLIGGYLLAVAGLCVATSIYDRIVLGIRPQLRATKVVGPGDGEVIVTLPSGR
jgi:undecaprenyl-diphosphatase